MFGNIIKQLFFPVSHPPCLRASLNMIEAQDMKQPVNDERKKPLIKRDTGVIRLLLRPFYRNYEITEDLITETVLIREGNDISRRILPEALPVQFCDPLIVGEKNAKISTL
jgi:hypothetical protein